MACYHPIPAYHDPPRKPKLWPPLGTANLAIPCSKCIGCRTDRATQWAHRCAHEAKSFTQNIFLTLTYADEHLPQDWHLQPRHLQLFTKRLRKHAARASSHIIRDRNYGIRYFACGEYGDQNQRPHYHALLFNCGLTDHRRVGKDLYESETINQLWPYGQHRFGPATAAAASYIAQYSLKKQGAGDHDPDGVWRPAPFLRMSLKPAIGNQWLHDNYNDLTHGYLVANGQRKAIPRTYLTKLKQHQPQLTEEIDKTKQQHRIRNPTDNNTPERKEAAERIHTRLKQLNDRRHL